MKLKYSAPSRAHEVQIGKGVLSKLNQGMRGIDSREAFIVSDRSLKQARESLIRSLRANGWSVHEIPVQAGERLKDFKNILPIYTRLLQAGAHRDAVLFALGGGSVGDAAGFVASTYLRGISWVGVPTTLLAQVDSSVGGKTGINLSAGPGSGKNLIGAFHQPCKVICEIEFLNTLSKREIVSGLGEALKYGLIYDPAFFKFIQRNWAQALDKDPTVLTQIVRKSLAWKAKVVVQDEQDRTGVREVLNFGHTLGHALEEATGYKVFQHGEAVIWGMRFALALSELKNGLARSKRLEIERFLSSIPTPRWPDHLSLARVLAALSKDKKIRAGKLHFVLLKDYGKTFSCSNVSVDDLHAAHALLSPDNLPGNLADKRGLR